MNQQNLSSALGTAVGTSGGLPLIPQGSGAASNADLAFESLVTRLAASAVEQPDPNLLVRFLCHSAREFFQVSGVYFWRCQSDGELIGEHASGKAEERFPGLRLRSDDNSLISEVISQRRTVFGDHIEPSGFISVMGFEDCSFLATPVVVSNHVTGVLMLVQEPPAEPFGEELAAKAKMLAGQLGTQLESVRSSQATREEHRRGAISEEVAHAIHGGPDAASLIEALADRLRVLLRTRLVCVLLRREGPFELKAISAETPQLATSARARHDRQTLRFAADLAQRAIAAGEPITLSIGADVHSLGSLVSPGMLIAAPFRTSLTQGAILIYPRADGVFSSQERALVSAVAGFGAVALAHAELRASSDAQAHELNHLLEICSELGSSTDLEHFLQAFVVRAADFLGFARCFIALLDRGQFRVRYGVERGQPRRIDEIFPEGIATKALRSKEVFWTDEASRTPGANLDAVACYQVHQFLAAPLLSVSGKLLGMFGVLDRLDGTSISQEDLRRARALSSQAAIMLEAAADLHVAGQNRRRAETILQLARDIDDSLRLPEFPQHLVSRIAESVGFPSGLLAVLHDSRWRIEALHLSTLPSEASNRLLSAGETGAKDSLELKPAIVAVADAPQPKPRSDALLDRDAESAMAASLAEFLAHHSENIQSRKAAEVFGPQAAKSLGWFDCTLVVLPANQESPSALLCLSGRNAPLDEEDRASLQAIAPYAGRALETSRLFTRVEQANRNWMEIFDAIADFIVVHDPADKVLRVNRSLAAMIGVPSAELVGVNMSALMALTSETASYSCPFCRSLSDDSGEFAHPVFDRTYLVSTSRVPGVASEPAQTVHVLKDVSDRREAERRYRELFDNIQEGLFFSTPAGRFIEVNDAMVRMLGYASREELLQIDIPTQLYFSPEQRQHHTRVMNEQGALRNFEATLRRKDGSPIHVLINAFGLYDNAGQLLQLRGLMLDVTGLRTYQSELHRERDFSGKILSNTQSLILVADTAGLISYANRRWFDAGFEQSELLGRPLLELAAPSFNQALVNAIQSTLNGQQIDNLELEIVRRSGAAGKFSANLSPMRDEQGTVTSIVLVLTDITDSAVLRDKLVHAEKMAAVGQLVSGVAHEVNNPLTAILGFADLLMENPDLPETARKDLRVILQEAQRTKQIVQNLLSFARQMPPQRNPLQLNTILRRTIQLRSYDFNSHGVEIIEHLDEDLPDVIGDAHQLQQVFLNILNNAYDAVHEVGRLARIEIMTTKAGDCVEVSFTDNGKGISHPDKIFDPFFTTKEVGKGTGLGLSICYGIVKEHAGEILCHNNIAGQGATFIVRLPAASHTANIGVAAGVNPS